MPLIATEHQLLPVPAGLPDVSIEPTDGVRRYLDSARARNTIRGYASDWKQFLRWCAWRGVSALPASEETIALYISENAGRLKAGTLEHHLAAVTKAHRAAGLPSPTREGFLVSETLKGVKRVHGSAVAQKSPVLTEDLRVMLRSLAPGTIGVRDRALLLVGFDLEWLIGAVDGHEWLPVLLLLDVATGCRRGELLGLAWPDVDLDHAILTISKSLAQTRAKGVFLKLPKGRRARKFSLSSSIVEAMRKHRAAQQTNRDAFGADYRADLDLVFATPEGEYLKPDSVTAKVSLLLRKLGFPKGVSLHTLRHTHGSHLLSSGVPLPAVSKRLGHANTHVTAEVYSHALEKDDQLSADAWERTMGSLGKSSDIRKQ